ncbi:MAG: hypothetical protein WEC59_05045 [Salibacteraceae bacterium]
MAANKQNETSARNYNSIEGELNRSKSNYPVRYAVKDGMIEYRYEGVQEGTEKVYFTHYGMTEIKYTHTERFNPFSNSQEKIDLVTLMRDTAIYLVDLNTKNARKMDNSLLYESAAESPNLDLNEAAESIYLKKGGLKVSTDSILGLPTDHWKIEQTNMEEWRWKGIMLKTKVELPKNIVYIEAITIDTVSPLPEGIFELPKDVNPQDGMTMKEWLELYKKPIKKRQVFNRDGTPKN